MDISFFNPNFPPSGNNCDPLPNPQSLERRLEASEARIDYLMATLPQIVWLAEVNGLVTNFNPRWYEYTGLTAEESLGWEFLQAIHPEDRDFWRDSFTSNVLASDEAASNQPPSDPDPIECRIRGADGTYRWFIAQRTAVRDIQDQILEWVGTYTPKDEPADSVKVRVPGQGERARESSFALFPFADSRSGEDSPLGSQNLESHWRSLEPTLAVTTGNQRPAISWLRKQTLSHTAQSEPQSRRNWVNELSHAIIWEAEATTDQFTFVSHSAERLLGYPVEQWLQEPDFWVNLIHPEDRQWTVAVCRQKRLQYRDYELEYRCLAADQRVVWLRDRAYVIRDDQGWAYKRRGLMVDITFAKQAEAELQVRLRQQAAIAQLSQQVLLSTDLSTFMDECLSLLCQTLTVEYCQVWEWLPDRARLKLRAGVGWRDELLGQVLIDASAKTQAGYTLQLCQPVILEDLRRETRFRGSPLLHDHNIISGLSVIIGGASSLSAEGDGENCSIHTELPNLVDGGDKEDKGDKGENIRCMTATSYQTQDEPQTFTPALPHASRSELTPATRSLKSRAARPFGVLAVHTSRQRAFNQSDVDFVQSVANVLAGAILFHQTDEALDKAQAQLAQMTAAVEKYTRELDEFAYITSHDLKAPLRAIANLSQWIEEDISDQLNPENQHQLQLLRGKVYRLEALIEGLLQYSRAGRLKPELELVDVAALLKQVISALNPPTQFTITLAPDMPTLMTQRLPLAQVFTHLIDNAIKHHPLADGTVTIDVQEQSDAYEFRVADDGLGIAPQFHERVFRIFQTLQAKDTVENIGVGLAIVQRIVEGKGGTIRLESHEGQGATFYFTWPKVLCRGNQDEGGNQ